MKHNKLPLISPIPGIQRFIDSFHFGYPNLGKKIYIQSSLYADEFSGILVVWKLKQALQQLEQQGLLDGEIILVPVANPIRQNQNLLNICSGCNGIEFSNHAHCGCYEILDDAVKLMGEKLGDKVLLNKQKVKQELYSALETITPNTEYQSQQKALQMLYCNADIILDLRCNLEAITHTYCTNYSWQAIEPLARLLKSQINIITDDTGGHSVNFFAGGDVIWTRLKERFGDRLGDYSCYSATLEISAQAEICRTGAGDEVNAILMYLSYLGVVSDSYELPRRKADAIKQELVESLISPIAGIIIFHQQPGVIVSENQLIAEVINPLTDDVDEIRATQAGILFSITRHKMAVAGMLVARIAGNNKI